MHVGLCLSYIVDPLLPSRGFRIDDHGRIEDSDLPHTMGPYDEAALELGLRLKDAGIARRLTAITIGDSSAEDIVRRAYALHVDDGLRIETDIDQMFDPRHVVQSLAAAVRSLDLAVDVVLIGRVFGDWDDGVVPPLFAEVLGVPFIGMIHSFELVEGKLVAVRRWEGFMERIMVLPPVVVSVDTHPEVRLRFPLVKNVIASKKRGVRVLSGSARTAGTAVVETVRPWLRRIRGRREVVGEPLDLQVKLLYNKIVEIIGESKGGGLK